MADVSLIQPAFSAGELSPALYGRVDLTKYHSGAATMRNFFVDYKGGASSRPGTQSITSGTFARLIPFAFSGAIGQTYILVFTNNSLSFIKNPGGAPPYPNSSNAGVIQAGGGGNYSISTPYAAADLPRLKYSQSGDTMYLTHPSYPRQVLKRLADNNWTLTSPDTGTSMISPTINTIAITGLPAGSTDPQQTSYLYTVTAVSAAGEESNFGQIITVKGIDIATTQGSITINWSQSTNAAYYKVYKAIPTPGNVVPSVASDFGFVGFAYGTEFTDGNIVPDFTQTPPLHFDPFPGGGMGEEIIGYNITAVGTGFPNYPAAVPITDSTGSGAYILPISTNNTSGGTGGIGGLRIVNGGQLYTAPSASSAFSGGTGFTVTFTLGPTNRFPTCSAFFQQRLVYAGTPAQPVTMFGTKPGFYNNFDTSNPPVDSDGFTFTIAAQQVNAILHMVAMPGGLVLFTDGGVQQLTGGSSGANNPLAVTPTSAVLVPQSYFGCSDVRPIVINYDILYVASQGSLVYDLAYNFFVNIYTGADITYLSSHLFYPNTIIAWAYQHIPFKCIWAVRSDGVLLSLTYLKEQEIFGWARHDTPGGLYEDVAVVREGTVDGVYFSVNRGGTRSIERLCDRVYNQLTDAWCLDCGVSRVSAPSTALSGFPSFMNGTQVYAVADGVLQGPFTVSGGAITLTSAASNVVGGYLFIPQLQTLYLDISQGEQTVQGKRKKIAAMSTRVKDSAGVKMGTTFNTLTLWRQGISSTDPIQPTSQNGLTTGDMRIIMDPNYSVPAQVCIQADQGLPCTVLSVIPEVSIGDR